MGALYKSYRVWEGVEECFLKRFALWKRQYLSEGGRQTLIKSTLSSLRIYFMSMSTIPKRVAVRLEKNAKGFSMGRGRFESQTTFGELVCLLHGKTKRGFGHQKFIHPK